MPFFVFPLPQSFATIFVRTEEHKQMWKRLVHSWRGAQDQIRGVQDQIRGVIADLTIVSYFCEVNKKDYFSHPAIWGVKYSVLITFY